ncbi:hypothetical protein I545_4404 [Mycobacterium kansasii 662]|uniref:Uncharacterized protein n=2 Tax=Mycobacterium kansasii TaxID=1768 RepID=A0A1V3WRB7_MYCKA|nr:hypothetical protein I547_2018 [Mycobacterium kansasii 824]EUA15896.1 hypothetical protein I545_4404 [Mycobacterium kansasii 662]OOK68726.1 hypothetical protein BZL30_7112 [Mycobacterium kansasii]OOK69489.1 hypothetical protein BZL29_6232 [Mycobacterium kansasii]
MRRHTIVHRPSPSTKSKGPRQFHVQMVSVFVSIDRVNTF